MVFCNTVPSCDWSAHCLADRGFDVVKLHGSLRPEVSWDRPSVVLWLHTLTVGLAFRSARSALSGSDLETSES